MILPRSQARKTDRAKAENIAARANSDYFLAQPDPAGVNSMIDYLGSLIERCYQQVMMWLFSL
jgi:hypothetical protein